MRFVSTVIGTADRVPLPDAIIRAAIQRLCSRTATRLSAGSAESDASFAAEMADRAIAKHRCGQCPPSVAKPSSPFRISVRPSARCTFTPAESRS
jgi:cyclopropane-fatty-acyl-phospholipid synthase